MFYQNTYKKQECIPLGCVPSAAIAVCWAGCLPGGRVSARGVPRGVSAQRVSTQGGVCPGGSAPVHAGIHPPIQNDRQV